VSKQGTALASFRVAIEKVDADAALRAAAEMELAQKTKRRSPANPTAESGAKNL
jgi:hypothetical protein